MLTKTYLDKVYPAQDVGLMHALVFGVLAFSIASTCMSGLRGYVSQVVSAKLMSSVSLLFFNHLQHLPVRFFDEHRVGEIMSRFGDVRSSLSSLANVLQTIVLSGFHLALIPLLLFVLDWQLALMALLSVPLTTAISTASGRLLRQYWKRSAEATADLGAFNFEVMSQIRSLKTLAAEGFVYQSASSQLRKALSLQLKATGFSTLVSILNGVVRATGAAIYTWYAWTLILRGDLTIGEFFAFSAYLGFFTGPIGQVAGLFSGFQRTAVTLGRAFEYLDATPEQNPRTAFREPRSPPVRLKGDVDFDRVSFGYGERRVLHDLTFHVDAGALVAVIGQSGAGKSTLLRLLVRFEVPDQGEIRVDGQSIRGLQLSDLRSQIGVVWQDFSLMRGTVWDNLTFGLSHPSRELVHEAVRVSRLTDVVRTLPNGFETPIAEWGATLSGGQRQRFAVARALIRDTPILLLDEATSQIDVATEQEMLRELFAWSDKRTVLMVTHRLATASLFDRLLLIEEGRIVGDGTHDQLAACNAQYRRMIAANSGQQAENHTLLAAVS